MKFLLIATLIISMNIFAGPGGGGGGGSSTWSAACLANFSATWTDPNDIYCPSGMVIDNNTCGCTPAGLPPVCTICTASTTCGSSHACTVLSGCQGLVCAPIDPAFEVPASSVGQENITINGNDICTQYVGASSLKYSQRFKEKFCGKILFNLKKFQDIHGGVRLNSSVTSFTPSVVFNGGSDSYTAITTSGSGSGSSGSGSSTGGGIGVGNNNGGSQSAQNNNAAY